MRPRSNSDGNKKEQLLKRRLRRGKVAPNLYPLGRRMQRNLVFTAAPWGSQASVAAASSARSPAANVPWVTPGDAEGDLEAEDELADHCVLTFRGDAVTHKADPIGRSGPRRLRKLACQLFFARDGGHQRDSVDPLTLKGVSTASPPANSFREHRLSSGALVVLISCPACSRSAVSFYIRRSKALEEGGSPGLRLPGCGADFALGDLEATYRLLGLSRPWLRQAVVCSGSGTHLAARSKPADFAMLLKAMASQLAKPSVDENQTEKTFIAAASTFNTQLLYGQPRAVAAHLALKCGAGSMARIHQGTWRGLERWAHHQGLSVKEVLKQYHRQTYLPGQLTVAVLDRRPLNAIEAAIGTSLSFLGYQMEDSRTKLSPLDEALSPTVKQEVGAGIVSAEPPPASSCSTPALHYLECSPDEEHAQVFFSFFLPGAAEKTDDSAAAGQDIAVSLRARRLLAAMVGAAGTDSLLGRLVASGTAVHAAVHLPISNDSGALLQIKVVLMQANMMQRLENAGEMLFAFIAGLLESPPAEWFVAEQQRLAAFDKIFSVPKDILQAAIDAATDAAHASDLGVVEKSDLSAAEAATARLLEQLSPSRLHLVLQSPSVDALCSRIQAETLARHGDGKINKKAYEKWTFAFRSRSQQLASLLHFWGLKLPKKNTFAEWSFHGEELSLAWRTKETDIIGGDTMPSTGSITPISPPSPLALTETPVRYLETLGIPRGPAGPGLAARRKPGLTLNIKGATGDRSLSNALKTNTRGDGYVAINFPASHPCRNKCLVLYRKCGGPNDPRAAVSLRLNSWVGQTLVPREEAAAEVFLSLVRTQTETAIEAASRAGIAAASSAGTFAAETHDSSVRRGDTIVFSVSGPTRALEGVLLTLLLPLSPPGAAAAARAGAAAAAAAKVVGPTDISQAGVSAANYRLLASLQDLPRPTELLTEAALDILVFPQKTRESLCHELQKARVDRQLLVSWRDSLWQRMALQATIEGNISEEGAVRLISMVLNTLKPTELVATSEAVPTRVLDLRGVYALSPPLSSPTGRPLGETGETGETTSNHLPPTALYIHPIFSKTTFHAVRVYVQLGPVGPEVAASASSIAAAAAASVTARAAVAAGEWFAASITERLWHEGRVQTAAKPPYFVSIGGIGYLSCTLTSNTHLQTMILSLDAAVQSIARLTVEEALREVELASEWRRSKNHLLCPSWPFCNAHVSREELPLLDYGIELALRALKGTPRLLLAIRGSLVSRTGSLGLGFGLGGEEELGELPGVLQLRDTEGFKETILNNGFYFYAVPNF